ncbi:hypothetical protein GCM10022261_04990 [Brevibacterium daeguense]|uniref:STAS domain-containing protein n=1 Tax=Brevibacterium daeguense TaxID=909936 RepID=A0ABP8EGC8_9MICO|nr:hypothetical protein [Brevibacterium daeguense]
MEDQLQILVRAETSTTSIVIQAEGALTAKTVGSLLRAIARAGMLQGCSGIYLDLRRLERTDPEAWASLEEYVQAFGRQPPIRIVNSWSTDSAPTAGPAERRSAVPHAPAKKARRKTSPKPTAL